MQVQVLNRRISPSSATRSLGMKSTTDYGLTRNTPRAFTGAFTNSLGGCALALIDTLGEGIVLPFSWSVYASAWMRIHPQQIVDVCCCHRLLDFALWLYLHCPDSAMLLPLFVLLPSLVLVPVINFNIKTVRPLFVLLPSLLLFVSAVCIVFIWNRFDYAYFVKCFLTIFFEGQEKLILFSHSSL